MYKLAPVLMLTAVAGVSIPAPVVAAQRLMAPLSGPSAADTVPQAVLVLVGGMGGMTGGGMGGMTGGGMGGITGGGMGGITGGGMGGITGGGMGGITGGGLGGTTGGGTAAYGGAAGYGGTSGDGYQGNGGSYESREGRQQYYQCIAPHGQCPVTSSPGSLRHGASCTCLVAGRGKIK
jgi:hypothetical protein